MILFRSTASSAEGKRSTACRRLIHGVEIYIAKVEGKDDTVWSGFRIWTGHSEDGNFAATEEGKLRYHELLDQMRAAPAGRDAVEAELRRRGKVIRFGKPKP